jgi:hypothetical protein
MTVNYKDALGLKSMEMAQQCCEDDKSLNQPMVRMTLPLFNRRKTMLIWYFSGRLNPGALTELCKMFRSTKKALMDDWEDRHSWEAYI